MDKQAHDPDAPAKMDAAVHGGKAVGAEIGAGSGATQVEKARPEGRPASLGAEPVDLGVNEKHLVRKLDICLIPLVMALYLFSFLDR